MWKQIRQETTARTHNDSFKNLRREHSQKRHITHGINVVKSSRIIQQCSSNHLQAIDMYCMSICMFTRKNK